jgi:8-oxo-dGTP diphosphatase
MSKIVQVAVGVIKNSLGQILIAKRANDVHQGGLWEFPGGKVEAGESVLSALARELREELAIEVSSAQPLIQICHDYGDKSVQLDVCIVEEFTGTAVGNEGQPVRWVNALDLNDYEFPAANRPIITALQLPDVMLITADEACVQTFERKLQSALARGVNLVQLRQPELSAEFIELAKKLCSDAGAHLQLNTSLDSYSGVAIEAGLHLSSQRLMALEERPVPLTVLFGASCHNERELQQAHAVGVDYILLSPVLPTNSHPNGETLGWDTFRGLVASCKVPVYALGGMTPQSIEQARVFGAQGVAGISAWW